MGSLAAITGPFGGSSFVQDLDCTAVILAGLALDQSVCNWINNFVPADAGYALKACTAWHSDGFLGLIVGGINSGSPQFAVVIDTAVMG